MDSAHVAPDDIQVQFRSPAFASVSSRESGSSPTISSADKEVSEFDLYERASLYIKDALEQRPIDLGHGEFADLTKYHPAQRLYVFLYSFVQLF